MATVSFLNMDQTFSIEDISVIGFSAQNATNGGFQYSFLSTGGDDWEVAGSGVTTSGGVPTGGTVTGVEVDLDNDGGAAEFSITGLSNIPLVDFGIGVGLANDQRVAFWLAALGGSDTINFTMASYTSTIIFAGDGAEINNGQSLVGGDDSFLAGAQAIGGGSKIIGDYVAVNLGSATGGDDLFTVGALQIYGDFDAVNTGTSATGGDDTITPVKLDGNLPSIFTAVGDAFAVVGDAIVVGGNDLIDLSATDITGYGSARTRLVGDAFDVGGLGMLTGGDDTIHGTSLGDDIHGEYFGSIGTVIGGDDMLFGHGGDDFIEGNTGDDTISGGAGADSLDGGEGVDTVDYSDATTKVTVRLWNQTATGDVATGDVLTGFENAVGGSAGDAIVGSESIANFIDGGSGADTLYGLSGNDTIKGGASGDILNGGEGVDTVDYSDATTKVTVRLWNQTATGDVATGDALTGFENVLGGSGGDAIVGSDGVANFINGAAGNDVLYGLSGNDTIRGGIGADTMDGGTGFDTLDYSDATGKVTVRLWNQTATGDIATGDALTGFENVVGGSAGDAIVGADTVANKLFGGAGDDTLFGLSGNDTIEGGTGADVINGGAGTDYVSYSGASSGITVALWSGVGSKGDALGDKLADIEGVVGSSFNDGIVGSNNADVIFSGLGDDALYGKLGNDTFGFVKGYDKDTIYDWSGGAGASDVIRLIGFGAAFDTFAEVMAAATQVGAHTVIDFGGGDQIVLVNTLKTSLAADDFIFG
ncbi:MAG: beta strand repeat-containing protein [Parvularculaceae bacterium]